MWFVVFLWSLRTSASVHSGGAEGLPDNCLTDVGGNEEGDTRAKTVALLEELIQQQNNQTCHKQLETETECRSKNEATQKGFNKHKDKFKLKSTWMMMSRHIPAPISEGSPYMPVITYTIACPMVMIIPNTADRQKGGQKLCQCTIECVGQSGHTKMLSKPSETGKVRRRPTFLSSIEQGSVLGGVSHFNDFGTSQQLHDKP